MDTIVAALLLAVIAAVMALYVSQGLAIIIGLIAVVVIVLGFTGAGRGRRL